MTGVERFLPLLRPTVSRTSTGTPNHVGMKRPPLVTWLVDELNNHYDVPRKVGKVWVDDDALLLLLDGLDEVRPEHRSACVKTINAYRQEHGLVPLAVTAKVALLPSATVRFVGWPVITGGVLTQQA